jgi:hypothetical protein
MEMVVYVVLVSETPLPITEKENQPIHFVFLLHVYVEVCGKIIVFCFSQIMRH